MSRGKLMVMNLHMRHCRGWWLSMIVMLALLPLPRATAQPEETLAVITPDNAAQVAQVRQLGLGGVTQVLTTPDGNTLLVVTSAGVWRYDLRQPSQAPSLLGGKLRHTVFARLSTEGRYVAIVTGTDQQAGIYVHFADLETGEAWVAMESPKSVFAMVEVVGTWLVGQSVDNRVWLYDMQRRRVVRTFDEAFSAAIHLSSDTLAVTTARGVTLWTLSTLEERRRIRLVGPRLTNLRFTPDGKRLYALNIHETFHAFDLTTFLPDYQLVARHNVAIRYDAAVNSALMWGVVGNVPNLRLVDLATGTVRFVFSVTANPNDQDASPRQAAISADGTRVAALGMDGTLRVWDAATGKMLAESNFEGSTLFGFTSDSRRLVLSRDLRTLLYDYEDQRSAELPGDFGHLWGNLAFSPNGMQLAATTLATVQLWDTQSWQPNTVFTDGPRAGAFVTAVSFTPDNTHLMVAAASGVWQVPLSAPRRNEPLAANRRLLSTPAYAIAVSPDGRWLAGLVNEPGGDVAIVRDFATQKVVWTHDGTCSDGLCGEARLYPSNVAFSPDSQTLFISQQRREFTQLDLATLTVTKTSHDNRIGSGQIAALYSRDGRWIITMQTGGRLVHVFEAQSLAVRHTLRGHRYVNDTAERSSKGNTVLALSPDGLLLAVLDQRQRLLLYDTRTWQIVAEVTPNASDEGTYLINEVAFSPDGKWLAATTNVGVVVLWGVRR
jgi:WD40 repeat protein